MEDEEHLSSTRVIHRIKDHLLFNTLSLLAKILKECQVIKNPSRQQDMATIWGKRITSGGRGGAIDLIRFVVLLFHRRSCDGTLGSSLF